MSALVFVDTETTGLSLDDDIWEFAAIRREPDGTETARHLFVEHDHRKCRRLPESFRRDHDARFPRDGSEVARAVAAELIADFIADPGPPPHLVGAVPNFDAERMALLLDRYGFAVPWHYHLIDVENLAVGWLYGRYGPLTGGPPVEAEGEAVTLPWDSTKLSLAVGVDPAAYARHTAMGDVRWAMAIYDATTGGGTDG